MVKITFFDEHYDSEREKVVVTKVCTLGPYDEIKRLRMHGFVGKTFDKYGYRDGYWALTEIKGYDWDETISIGEKAGSRFDWAIIKECN